MIKDSIVSGGNILPCPVQFNTFEGPLGYYCSCPWSVQ